MLGSQSKLSRTEAEVLITDFVNAYQLFTQVSFSSVLFDRCFSFIFFAAEESFWFRWRCAWSSRGCARLREKEPWGGFIKDNNICASLVTYVLASIITVIDLISSLTSQTSEWLLTMSMTVRFEHIDAFGLAFCRNDLSIRIFWRESLALYPVAFADRCHLQAEWLLMSTKYPLVRTIIVPLKDERTDQF